MSNNPFHYAVWHNLSAINCSEFIELKGGLKYLSWANAWQLLMDVYPCSEFVFNESTVFPDGSMEVSCTITVTCSTDVEKKVVRTMWLPVMNHKNQAIINPNSREISDNRMRCLVKCCSLLGLGLHVYKNEELTAPEAAELKKPLTEDQVDNLVGLMEASETDYDQFTKHFKINSLSEMNAGQYQNALSILEKKLQRMEAENASH
jgi:hypothetical protein